MIPNKHFIEIALEIRKKAPSSFLENMCQELCACSIRESKSQVLLKMPDSINSDLIFLVDTLLSEHGQNMSWTEIGICLQSIAETAAFIQADYRQEIVWSGPATETFPVRRIDQVLYDLIQEAHDRIWLVTFAAAKIGLLQASLKEAIERGVEVNLVLEFESESLGQLSFDALNSFSEAVSKKATIYYWPLNMRERNKAGNPGKLHAKCAIIDNNAIISSANLTDDAFNRNMELGLLLHGGQIPGQLEDHIKDLIAMGILCHINKK